jgi:hypothetical protein
MKKTLFLSAILGYSIMAKAQPSATPAPGYVWVKTTANATFNGGTGYTGGGNGNQTASPCGNTANCGANDTSFGWSSQCSTVPTTTVGTPGNNYIQSQVFGNFGQTNANNAANAGLSLSCNPATGNPNWGTSATETRRVQLNHWSNAKPNSGVANGATTGQVYLPVSSKLSLFDDGVGNGTGVGGDELRFTAIGGNSGGCSSFKIVVNYDMKLTVSDPEFALANDVIIPTQTVTQTTGYFPDAGANNSYNLTDNAAHNCSGNPNYQTNASSWYFPNGSNQSGFGTGVGNTSTGAAAGNLGAKVYTRTAGIGEAGGTFNVDFKASADITTTRVGGNADGRATMGPGMGGKANYVVTYDVWDLVLDPRPVKLSSFSATQEGKAINLKWITATETANDYFGVERSSNAKEFGNIAKITGKNTTEDAQFYTFKDQTPLSGISYYRLRQVDLDGKFEYSRIIAVSLDESGVPFVYPNPAHSYLTFSSLQKDAVIELVNLQGKVMYHGVATSSVLDVDVSKFEEGNYVSRIITGNQVAVSKVLIHH